MILEQYGNVTLTESTLMPDVFSVESGTRVWLFSGETGYHDAFRFYMDIVLGKVYG